MQHRNLSVDAFNSHNVVFKKTFLIYRQLEAKEKLTEETKKGDRKIKANKQTNNMKIKRFRSLACRLERFALIVYRVWLLFFASSELTYFILQCLYIKANKQFADQKDENQVVQEETLVRLKALHYLMRQLGAIYRELGGASVFFHAAFFSCNLMFFLMDKLLRKRALASSAEKGFIFFLTQPERECKRVDSSLNELLSDAIESNLNFTQSITDPLGLSASLKINSRNIETISNGNEGSQSRQPLSSESYEDSLIGQKFLRKRKALSCKNHPMTPVAELSLVEKPLFQQDNMRRSKCGSLVADLNRQLEYLMALCTNKGSIWPENRKLTWLKDIKRTWLLLQLSSVIFFNTIGQCIILSSFKMASRALNEANYPWLSSSKQNSDLELANLRRFTFADRLCILNIHMALPVGMEWFLTPLSYLIACALDQFKTLASLNEKFKRLEFELDQLAKLRLSCLQQLKFAQCKQSTPSVRACDSNVIMRNFYLNDENSRRSCDRLAIKLYLSYQLFRADARCSLGLAEWAIDQRSSFALFVLITTSLFVSEFKLEHLSLVAAGCMVLWIGLNVAFCIFAVLQAACDRTTKRFWSLIAGCVSVALLYPAQDEGWHPNDASIRERLSWAPTLQAEPLNFDDTFLAKLENSLDKQKIALSLQANAVTPHTLFLLHRLLANQRHLSEGFHAKLYGTWSIDFTGILKINFWAISCIIVTLTYISN